MKTILKLLESIKYQGFHFKTQYNVSHKLQAREWKKNWVPFFLDKLYLSLHLKSSLLKPWPRGARKAMLLRVYVKFQGQRVVQIKLITGIGFIPHFNKNIEPEYSLILVVRDCSSSSLQTWCSCDGQIKQKNKLKIRLYFVLQQFTKCDLTCRTSLSQR